MSDYLGETILFKKINSQEPMYAASAVDTLINGLSGDYYTKPEIDDNFYTKTQIDSKIASVYHFKGSVDTYVELKELTGMDVGDVYNVSANGKNYAWTGVTSAYDDGWDVLGGTFDLDEYYTKDEADGLLSAKVDKVDGMGLSHNDFTDSNVTQLAKAYGFTVSGGLVPGNSHETKLGVGESDYNFTYMTEEGLHVGYQNSSETSYESGGIYRLRNGNSYYITLPTTSGTLALTSDINSAVSGKVDKVEGMGLSHNDFTDAYVEKLDAIPSGAQENVIETIKVDGAALPVTEKTVEITLSGKVDKVEGMGLSHNDFTDEAVAKVNGAFQTSGGTVSGVTRFKQSVYTSGDFYVVSEHAGANGVLSDDRVVFATTGPNFKETQYRNGEVFFDNGVTESVISIPAKSGTFALVSDIATETSGKADSTAFTGLSSLALVDTNDFDVETLATKYNTLVTMLSGIAVALNS